MKLEFFFMLEESQKYTKIAKTGGMGFSQRIKNRSAITFSVIKFCKLMVLDHLARNF